MVPVVGKTCGIRLFRIRLGNLKRLLRVVCIVVTVFILIGKIGLFPVARHGIKILSVLILIVETLIILWFKYGIQPGSAD